MKPAWPAIKTKARKRRFLRGSGKLRVFGCYAVYTDHINTPRLATLVNNPLNPVPITDTSNDLPAAGWDNIQGISPHAMPVWQMAYSAFGPDLANGYEARPTTINTNFKPDLWEWLGLPSMGGADDWSWYAGGGNGLANGSVLTAPVLNIRYPGQYYDAESGLSQNWWRSYDARMGRYTQNDPIGLEGGMNRFNYVGGDPLSKVDPTGELPVLVPIIVGAGVTAYSTYSLLSKQAACERTCELTHGDQVKSCGDPERQDTLDTHKNSRVLVCKSGCATASVMGRLLPGKLK